MKTCPMKAWRWYTQTRPPRGVLSGGLGPVRLSPETSEAAGAPDKSRARELLKGVSLNTGSMPESARRALTQVGLGYGDALLTYENEALLDISKGKDYEIVVPLSTIYIQPKVLILDRM